MSWCAVSNYHRDISPLPFTHSVEINAMNRMIISRDFSDSTEKAVVFSVIDRSHRELHPNRT